ncbi:MAG: ribosome maturation factor RimP [Gammaproteobacteria bacterium]|nr:ribosome maturation factor RimP [Gammaproteobacteria bacterium]
MGLGYELLGVERSRGGASQLLRLYIDHADGITVEDCERVSRQVSDLLDAEQLVSGEYTLEVSSPGLDRPLFTLEQHRRFIGEEVALRLRALVGGRRRVTGRLLAVNDESLLVDVEGESLDIPYREVERSRLVPDWAAEMNRQRQPAAD